MYIVGRGFTSAMQYAQLHIGGGGKPPPYVFLIGKSPEGRG